MAGVRIVDITKVYAGGVVAVHKANLEVADREFVVLVGPSGCGKSTFLRMIAGLETITEGRIYIGDRLVNDLLPKDRNIAMVFQNYALYPHMTVRENLAFGLKIRKEPTAEIERRVREAAEILDILQLLDRKPGQLSGGQRQRVAVGRAIVRDPDVFLFDEPLSNLDAKLRVQMRAELSKLHRKLDATMIYVTHDQTEAMTMGNRIVVLKDGLIHQVAPPIEIYRHPIDKFVAGFIGSPPMNFITGRISGEGGSLYFDQSDFRVRVAAKQSEPLARYKGREIIMGIRPEDIYLQKYVGDDYPESQLDALVEVVEPVGAEMYVYFSAGKLKFVGRVTVREFIKVGETIRLVFDMSSAHFFDPASEKAVV
ncbi:MAG: sn-glycerol-3-phosphate ABC transporter ATP-binding protein UgpC [Candidatus Euphemobacter frigidus]|nr:sn-glycerol-3-phosphate ABC transporter ATP-binding protein UgpC [Candidatus Euphemobacter frigidus]MDP8276322.1 sn-glycerol-3-phosphate ABC transporter ATP-binding protein UgpC [Candidatus Euphemobacter frigidus]